MSDVILPEPVTNIPPVENPVFDSLGQPKSNRTLTVLVIIILVAFLGLVGGVVYDYLNNHSQDTTRRQDLSYIASQAETYYDFNHYYPSLGQINSPTFGAFNPDGIKKANFKDPTGKSEVLTNSPTPTGYAYEVSPHNCDNIKTKCLHFKLVAVMSSNQDYTVDSRH